MNKFKVSTGNEIDKLTIREMLEVCDITGSRYQCVTDLKHALPMFVLINGQFRPVIKFFTLGSVGAITIALAEQSYSKIILDTVLFGKPSFLGCREVHVYSEHENDVTEHGTVRSLKRVNDVLAFEIEKL